MYIYFLSGKGRIEISEVVKMKMKQYPSLQVICILVPHNFAQREFKKSIYASNLDLKVFRLDILKDKFIKPHILPYGMVHDCVKQDIFCTRQSMEILPKYKKYGGPDIWIYVIRCDKGDHKTDSSNLESSSMNFSPITLCTGFASKRANRHNSQV